MNTINRLIDSNSRHLTATNTLMLLAGIGCVPIAIWTYWEFKGSSWAFLPYLFGFMAVAMAVAGIYGLGPMVEIPEPEEEREHLPKTLDR